MGAGPRSGYFGRVMKRRLRNNHDRRLRERAQVLRERSKVLRDELEALALRAKAAEQRVESCVRHLGPSSKGK
jgi:hypothetical protein